MVALLLSAVAIMPVFGAVTGTVVVDKAFVAPDGTAKISVTDADLNVLTAATNTPAGTWGASGTTVFLSLEDSNGQSGASFGSATAAGDEIAGTPVVAASSDSAALTSYAVGIFNRATGRISVQWGGSTADAPGADTLTITYNLASKNSTAATVTSPSDTSGITVVLNETGADTGVFEGTFGVNKTATNADAVPPVILAVAGQDVTVKYTDASPSVATTTTLRVEGTEPVGALISPADGSETTSLAPVLTVDFTDVDSTVDSGTIAFVITSATAASDTNVASQIVIGTPTVTAITNGFRAVSTLDVATAATDKTVSISWHATINDLAGNTGQTDADAATSGDQDYTLVIDQQGPNFVGSTIRAGTWWDAGASTPAVEDDETKSNSTTIAISLPDALAIAGTAYDLEETLSAGTITGADFEVDSLKGLDGTTTSDITPSAANVYAGAPNYIFLTVPEMAPDARPTVILLSGTAGICDTAGNCTTTGTVAGTDEQAPTVTVSSNRDATGSLDDADGTLTITTNEAGAPPVVTIVSATDSTRIAQAVVLIGTNVYESKITPAVTAGSTASMHSIRVVVTDTNSNVTTVGGKTVTALWPVSGALSLYVDSALPAPDVTANNETTDGGPSIEFSEPFFITAEYADETAEYGLASDGTIADLAANVATDLDIQEEVTVSAATLDGVSVLGNLDTQDNNTFNFAIAGIAVGDHDFEVTATDEAGNENVTKVSFTVTARKAYSVAMNAGWNLISFPGNPADGAIASVLPTTHPATDVLSYNDGVWSVASRTAGGTWEGTLTTIDGDHGYWVNSTSSQPVTSLLALTSVGSAATLPTIAVESGWNLVAVIDLKQTKQGSAGDTQTGANYMTSVDWSVAYSYNSSTRTWTRVTPSTGNVLNGQGVWVWASKSGTLIP
jgi:hypothetical protein